MIQRRAIGVCCVASALAPLLLVATAGHGQTHKPRQGAIEAGLFGGWSLLSEDGQLGNAPDPLLRPGSGPLLGGRVGLHLLEWLSVEAEVDAKLAKFRDSQLAGTTLGFRANALGHLLTGKWQPFFLLGFGGEALLWRQQGTEHDLDMALQAGVGLKVNLYEAVFARVDLRYVPMDGAEERASHNFAAHLGLGIRADPAPRHGDGLIDRQDRRPAEVGSDKHKGCPDADGDGTPDLEDKCPTVAGPDAGCPPPDLDRDGVVDAHDRCPKTAGPAALKGCPDADDDGIADLDDKCPNKFGAPADGGCPGAEEKVVVTKSEVKITETIRFATGKADIDRKSYGLLNAVAAVLIKHARLTLVRVEGHTDDSGDAHGNRKLSLSRAEAVVGYLVGKGVAGGRLKAAGFGAEQPVCKNLEQLLAARAKRRRQVAACREQNRRVQFKVVTLDGQPVGSEPAHTP